MGRLALLLLALCLVSGNCLDSDSKDDDLVEQYREVREELREIFAHGVDPETQSRKDASTSSGLDSTRTGKDPQTPLFLNALGNILKHLCSLQQYFKGAELKLCALVTKGVFYSSSNRQGPTDTPIPKHSG